MNGDYFLVRGRGLSSDRDIPENVYHAGVLVYCDKNYSYQIATPEKALSDKLYSLFPVQNLSELNVLLFDDIGIDEAEFQKLNMKSLSQLSGLYHATNLKLLKKLIRKNV